MDATKETCQHALENLMTQQAFMNEYAFTTLKNFLLACLKRLPTNEAVAKDRQRKTRRKEVKDAAERGFPDGGC